MSPTGARPPGLRVGVADHLGWAVLVTADRDHAVIDRRRVALVDPDLTPMPIHHDARALPLGEAAELVATVRASVERCTTLALDELSRDLPRPIATISLRVLADDFPTDLPTLLRDPWHARADAVMYREVLRDDALTRGWSVCSYDAKAVEAAARAVLGEETDERLRAPRAALGSPWAKDHRVAYAATIVAEGAARRR